MVEQDLNALNTVGSRGGDGLSLAVRSIEWWIIIKKKKKLQLHLLELLSSDTGPTVMSKLKAKFEPTKQRQHWWNSAPVIEVATISPYCIGDVEAQDYPREVLIQCSVPHPVLTKAFQRPGALRSTANFIALNSDLAVDHGAGRAGRPLKAVYIKVGVHRLTLFAVFTVILLLSVAAGLLVGFLSHSAALGLATTGAAVILVASVNLFHCWNFK